MQPDDRITQRHDERLFSRERFPVQDRVSEATLHALARVEDVQAEFFEIERQQQVILARLAQRFHQCRVGIEVILDRGLAAARHEQQVAHAVARQLLDDVLDDRLARDRQHLLGLRLGGRQQSRAKARDRYHGSGDRAIHGRRHVRRRLRLRPRCLGQLPGRSCGSRNPRTGCASRFPGCGARTRAR